MSGFSLFGVNLSGAEYDPGGTIEGTNYTYPSDAEIDYYASKGMTVIRLPFLLERVEPVAGGPLSTTELGYIDNVVDYAASKGIDVILDPHDYGDEYGTVIGTTAASNATFANFWGELASHFASTSNVLFGLMNEPNAVTPTQWLASANAAIAAIRGAGATTQQILVPGTDWDGADTWVSSGNAQVLGSGIVDPSHNFAFEVHQYLDADGSGTSSTVVSTEIGVERLTAITQWAEATGNKLFLGEFGVASDATSLTALNNMLGYMAQHTDVWEGGTYWAGGPWLGNYMYSVEPSQGVDKPQMAILEQYALPPDLTEYVAVNHTTVAAGGSLTIDAYDMNIGHGVSGPSTAQIYLSTSSTITASDTALATITSPETLTTVGQPGYYDHQTVTITLPGNLAPGTYYIGGIADYNNQVGESNETNNTYNVVQVTVTPSPQPDLTEYVAVNHTTVAAGGSLTIDAYDMNIGNAVSGASTAQIYLSISPTIATSDTVLATLTGPEALATVSQPGYYDHQTVTVTLPGNLAPGTYYIGGIADYNNQVSESNETNNTNNTYNVVQVTVTPPPQPDLTEYVAVNHSTVAAGGSLTIDAYDMNIGNAVSGASTAQIYLSTSSTITTSNTVLATLTSPETLATVSQPGYYDHQQFTVALPGNLAPGIYYIGGIADYNNQVSESNETNNTYNVVQVTVTPPPQPDLTEYVAVNHTTVAVGGSLTIDAYDMNIGNAVSGASTAQIYLSTSSTITTSDTVLATITSPETLATVSQSGYYDHQQFTLALPDNLAPGTYYIGGIADYNNQVSESNDANNTYNVVQITVTPPQAATIDAAAKLELTGADPASVTFNGATGSLILDHSSLFSGPVFNFTGDGNLSSSDQIDLKDIAFGAGTTVSYTGTSSGGTLTVSDAENHTAHIALAGDYTSSTFSLSNDGSGGTVVIDPAAKQDVADGTLSFGDAALADKQTVGVAPQNGGAGYVGNFTVDAVNAANGQDSVGWHFNFDSSPVSETVTQSYDVAVTDNHADGTHSSATQSVSVTIAGPGNDAFVFHPGVGSETIVNAASADTIELDGFSSVTNSHQLAQLLSEAQAGHPQSLFAAANGGHDTVINLGNHDVITLTNVQLAELHASNFIIG